MRILVQWARAGASDWEEIDSSDWTSLPKRPRPAGAQADSQRGWVCAVNVQGIVCSGDAIAVQDTADGGVRIWQVNDDPNDWGGRRHARVITVPPLRADNALSGAINTASSQAIFAEGQVLVDVGRPTGRVTNTRNYNRFNRPPEALFRYGVWMPDALYESHQTTRTARGWREWTEHLSASELDANGHVPDQRSRGRYIRPDGTRTYYHNVESLAIPEYSATNENRAGLVPLGATNQGSGNQGTNASQKWAMATPSNEPNSAAWPTGNYRHQIDCVTTTPDLAFGCLTQDSAFGGFARCNAGLNTELENHEQQEAAFSLTGLFLATTGSVSWTAGAADERMVVVITADKVAGHGQDTMTLQLGEGDDFVDGPWPAAGAPPSMDAAFFGANC